MYLNSEHYPCPTEGKAIAHVMAEKKAKSQEYKYIQECRRANNRLKNRMRNQNDQFILTWKPEDNSRY